MTYDRQAAVAYAHAWAFARNPQYADFSGMGGDCTNFCSQCLFAGLGVMNPTPHTGWYYHSLASRSPSWSGVEFLAQFLLRNSGLGPYAQIADLSQIAPGDIVQLSFDGVTFGHSLLVVETGSLPSSGNIRIATHTFDADNRALSTYRYTRARPLHMLGSRG